MYQLGYLYFSFRKIRIKAKIPVIIFESIMANYLNENHKQAIT